MISTRRGTPPGRTNFEISSPSHEEAPLAHYCLERYLHKLLVTQFGRILSLSHRNLGTDLGVIHHAPGCTYFKMYVAQRSRMTNCPPAHSFLCSAYLFRPPVARISIRAPGWATYYPGPPISNAFFYCLFTCFSCHTRS